MPVPDAWAAQDQAVVGQARPAEWRQFFRAPALTALIEAALGNNRDLRIAVWRVEVARSQYRSQRADRFPHVNVGATALRTQIPASLSVTGETYTANLYGGIIGASWDIDLWGRVRNLDAAALDNWMATQEGRRSITLCLIAEVANNWLTARELDERIALADRTVTSRRDSARIARRRFEVGAAPRIDQTQADTLLGEAESASIALEQQREATRNALAALVGQPLQTESGALSAVQDTAIVRDLQPGLPSSLLVQRPDIRAAEDRLRAAEANIGAARAAFFPRISLLGDYGTASTALENLFMGSGTAWIFATSAMAPIFDGGRLRGNLDGAKAERAIAVADYERAVQTAFRDVSNVLAARRWLGLQVAAETRTLEALTDRARLASLRYANGATTYLEVLNAQRDLFAAEQALVETRRTRLSSEVNLFAALGGGADDPSAAIAINETERSAR